MEVDADDDVLRTLASGGQMDYAQWPDLLSRLIPRLEKIVNEDFPKPNIPPQQSTIPSSQQTTQDLSPSQASQSSSTSANKENAPPTTSAATLPPQILVLITSITTTLTSLFSAHPPHTIQRLAELLLNPRQHYRSLPSYLHALDRVVHVSSGAHLFPLPPAIPDPSAAANVLSNGKLAGGADPLSISWGNPTVGGGLGSDESLGGALLTPISWLNRAPSSNGTHSPLEGEVKTESTEMVDGPNGPGGVETVSVSVNGISSPREHKETTPSSDSSVGSLRAEGGVTQGELLRQEQRAGVVPTVQLQNYGGDAEDEIPHARGPEEVGMEDLGPQEGSTSQRGGPGMAMQGINVEAAVGRRIEVHRENVDVKEEDSGEEGDGQKTPKREAEEEKSGDEKRVKEEGGEIGEEKKDALLADVDGKLKEEEEEEEPGVVEKEEKKSADAEDNSTVS